MILHRFCTNRLHLSRNLNLCGSKVWPIFGGGLGDIGALSQSITLYKTFDLQICVTSAAFNPESYAAGSYRSHAVSTEYYFFMGGLLLPHPLMNRLITARVA